MKKLLKLGNPKEKKKKRFSKNKDKKNLNLK